MELHIDQCAVQNGGGKCKWERRSAVKVGFSNTTTQVSIVLIITYFFFPLPHIVLWVRNDKASTTIGLGFAGPVSSQYSILIGVVVGHAPAMP